MRRSILISVFLFIVTLSAVMLYASGTSDRSRDPETVVRSAFRAYESGSAADLNAQFCNTRLAAMIAPQTGDARYRFSELTLSEPDRASSDTAVQIVASGRLHTVPSGAGDADSRPFRWTLDLVREDGAWCIASLVRAPMDAQ